MRPKCLKRCNFRVTARNELKFYEQVPQGVAMSHMKIGSHWCVFVALAGEIVNSAILSRISNLLSGIVQMSQGSHLTKNEASRWLILPLGGENVLNILRVEKGFVSSSVNIGRIGTNFFLLDS